MEIFKKKKLLIFIFLFFSFIPSFKINASTLTMEDLPELPLVHATSHYEIVTNTLNNIYLYYYEDTELITVNGAVTLNVPITSFSITFGGTSTASPIPGYASVRYAHTYKLNKSTNTWNYEGYNSTGTVLSVFDRNSGITYNDFQRDVTSITPYLKSMVIYTNINHFYYDKNTNNFTLILSASDYFLKLDEKKTFSYNNSEMTNSIRYIDLYFDKNDLGKTINFKLDIEDYFDYSNCSYCEYLNIDKFEFSYLIKDENNLYKWVDIPNINTGVGFDYSTPSIPRNDTGTGFVLDGSIYLNYDTSNYDFEKIRASIKLSNGYNFKYTYSDNSNISYREIDEYYSNMTYGFDKRLNRVLGGNTKYTVLSTTNEEINASLLIEYINTSKYLYVEYFDTLTRSYLENGMIYSYDYFIVSNRDIEKFNFNIGTNNSKGIYLMNYLYKRLNDNTNSYYYYYLPTDIYYYETDFLIDSLFYDYTGELKDNITPNSSYETDNIKFTDNFRIIYSFLDDMQETSDNFNRLWLSLYHTFPSVLQIFLQVFVHLLCMLIYFKIVGWE